MQVRIANRQDEKKIRQLVEAEAAATKQAFDLKGADSDLVNVEANYFGKEGLFLVAEEDGTIFGIAGARRKESDVLRIERILFNSKMGSDNASKREMLETIVSFAPRLLYSRIECGIKTETATLNELGFVLDGDLCHMEVTPDF